MKALRADLAKYPWGTVLQRHPIGDQIEIIEAMDEEDRTIHFHPYVRPSADHDWETFGFDTCMSYGTLHEAILGVLGYAYDGQNSQFDKFAHRMLKMDQPILGWLLDAEKD